MQANAVPLTSRFVHAAARPPVGAGPAPATSGAGR